MSTLGVTPPKGRQFMIFLTFAVAVILVVWPLRHWWWMMAVANRSFILVPMHHGPIPFGSTVNIFCRLWVRRLVLLLLDIGVRSAIMAPTPAVNTDVQRRRFALRWSPVTLIRQRSRYGVAMRGLTYFGLLIVIALPALGNDEVLPEGTIKKGTLANAQLIADAKLGVAAK